jgi:signal transduction histidine kinase
MTGWQNSHLLLIIAPSSSFLTAGVNKLKDLGIELPPYPEDVLQLDMEADRLQRLVNDLQELSRVEAGALRLYSQPLLLYPWDGCLYDAKPCDLCNPPIEQDDSPW